LKSRLLCIFSRNLTNIILIVNIIAINRARENGGGRTRQNWMETSASCLCSTV